MPRMQYKWFYGYSPYQLVFGVNPNLPSTLTDKPPALEGTTPSEMFAKHLNAFHAGHRAFIQAETSEQIRNVSVNSNWVHPLGNPRGFAQKNCPGGRELTFESCPGAGNSTRAGFFWKVQTMLNAI